MCLFRCAHLGKLVDFQYRRSKVSLRSYICPDDFSSIIFSCRPNFVVDSLSLEPWSEDSWTGEIKIGDTQLVYNKPCTRCQSTRVSWTSSSTSLTSWPSGWSRHRGSVQGRIAADPSSLVQTAWQVSFHFICILSNVKYVNIYIKGVTSLMSKW